MGFSAASHIENYITVGRCAVGPLNDTLMDFKVEQEPGRTGLGST